MKRTVVIGFGNPLRGDDGIGWRAAELIGARLAEETVEIIQCHQLTPELATCIEGAPLVIFLDASVDLGPGETSQEPVKKMEPGAWSHHFLPGQLLGLAEYLSGKAPPAVLIQGGVLSTCLGDTLSEVAAECASKMADLAITAERLSRLSQVITIT